MQFSRNKVLGLFVHLKLLHVCMELKGEKIFYLGIVSSENDQ